MSFSEPRSARFQRALLNGAFGAASRFARLLRRTPRDVEVLRNIAYLPDDQPSHRLDIYRPRLRTGQPPLLVYIHGGGFTVCSKESHWMMGELFAAMGFCVANIAYRLAPGAPYPAAVHDVRDAWSFITAHAGDYGADAARPVLAGESAGANLALGLALRLCAQTQSVRPAAVLPACGLLQISDPGRFQASPLVRRRIAAISHAYALESEAREPMASPLLVIEDKYQPISLPPVLVQVGTRDWVAEDSLRLHAALQQRGMPSTLHTYADQGHAFQAFYWTGAAQVFWRDTSVFLQGLGLVPQARGARTPNS